MVQAAKRWKLRSRSRVGLCLCALAVLATAAFFWKDICLWRARVNLAARQHQKAASWVDRSRWLATAPDPARSLLDLRIARRLLEFDRVESLLKLASTLDVSEKDLRRERLLAMAQTNQFHQMEGQWPELLNDPRDDGPEIAQAYYTWAMLHHQLPLAEKTLTLWHEDYPRDAEPLFLKGCFYQAIDQWEAAVPAYRDALKLEPHNDRFRLALARALQTRLQTEPAISLYQESLQEHPDNLRALQGLAECEAARGNIDSALGLLKRAIAISPNDFEVQKTCGEMLLAAGQAKAAVEILEKAYLAVPEHANLANSYARALKECGRNDEAERLFAFVVEARPALDELVKLEKSLQHQPDNLALRMKIASITARYVSRRDAIRWYENLILIAPNYRPAKQALAELYDQVNDVAKPAARSEKARGIAGTNDSVVESPSGHPGQALDTPSR